jgi:putative tryptophan/tyrosine transport system substrate-binding protein
MIPSGTNQMTIGRRQFISALGGAATVWSLAADAQQAGKVWRIGFLAGGSRPVLLESTPLGAFSRGMRELGYAEREDFIIEWRFAEGRYELFPDLAAELVRLNVDVIVLGTPAAIPAAQRATSTIPIVMATSTDPVGYGYVASLNRPGGNTTGLASSQDDIAPKQLELLAMCVPDLTRVGFLVNPNNTLHSVVLTKLQGAAQNAGLKIVPAEMQNSQDLSSAFTSLTNERVGAVLITGDALFFSQRSHIVDIALKARLPTMFSRREFVEAGGLISYGDSLADFYRRAAFYVDKIFKGAKPADLPIQQPTRFYTVINRKTANTLGLTIPLQLTVFADEVIE